MQVNLLEAKNRLSELIRSAEAGEDVIIANRGRAAVRLVPVAKAAEAPAQAALGPDARDGEGGNVAAILALIAKPRPALMRRTAAEIEADIAAIRDGWD